MLEDTTETTTAPEPIEVRVISSDEPKAPDLYDEQSDINEIDIKSIDMKERDKDFA